MFFISLTLVTCVVAATSVSMKTTLNFKASTAASACLSVPPFHATPWRCPTLSCCLFALFRTPQKPLSCSETSGTKPEFFSMKEVGCNRLLWENATSLFCVWCFPLHSKLQTYFQWEGMMPFHLSPERGLLGPNQECYITVVFQPQEALVYQEHASCSFGKESENAQSSCTVQLQGVGMHSETVILFKANWFWKDCVFVKPLFNGAACPSTTWSCGNTRRLCCNFKFAG